MDTQAKLGSPVVSKPENQKLKIKMQNDKSKFKDQFKKRLYNFALKLIEFLDKLPKDNVSKRVGDQLLRSGTGIIGNYVRAWQQAAKKTLLIFLTTVLNQRMKANYGLRCCEIVNVQNPKK